MTISYEQDIIILRNLVKELKTSMDHVLERLFVLEEKERERARIEHQKEIKLDYDAEEHLEGQDRDQFMFDIGGAEMTKHIVVIEVPVSIDRDGNLEEKTLRIEYFFGNVVEFSIDGNVLFGADWVGNIRDVFESVLNFWPGVIT